MSHWEADHKLGIHILAIWGPDKLFSGAASSPARAPPPNAENKLGGAIVFYNYNPERLSDGCYYYCYIGKPYAGITGVMSVCSKASLCVHCYIVVWCLGVWDCKIEKYIA